MSLMAQCGLDEGIAILQAHTKSGIMMLFFRLNAYLRNNHNDNNHYLVNSMPTSIWTGIFPVSQTSCFSQTYAEE